MVDEDLEKTKCLDDDMKELQEENVDVHEEYNNMLRERKYSNVQEELDEEKEEKENSEVDGDTKEISDDELNDKNLINNENKDDEEKDDEEKDDEEKEDEEKKKEKLFTRIKNKWSSFSKKKKIIICIITVLVLAGLITGLVLILKKDKKESDTKETPTKEEIVIKDNYIYKNGSLIFLDEDDNEIGTYECNVKNADKCYVAFNRLDEDNVNNPVNVYESGKVLLNRMQIYNKSYAFVYDSENEDGVVTLYDFKKEEEKDKFLLTKAYTIEDKDYIVAQNEDKTYTLYEMTSSGLKAIIEKDYKYLGIIDTKKPNYIIAKLSTGYYLLDFDGKEQSKLIGNQIFDYNEDYIVTVSSDNKYELYDYDNTRKLTGYRFIGLENDYVVLVDQSNKLYLKDKDLTKVNEEGFELNCDAYVPRNVFTEEKTKVKSEYAFANKYGDEKIGITILSSDGEDTIEYEIKLDEVKYNKTLKYYSYLNSKLYFYSDEAKEELLGSYECQNKNDSVEEDELLSNCRPALDTIYEDNDIEYDTDRVSMTPIINSKFVFIEDSTSNNKNVKLYDLVKKSTIDTYETVNTYTVDNKGELQHLQGTLRVVAKNKSGKYGTLYIDATKSSVEFKFNYNHIEVMGNKLLVQTDDNKWALITSKSSTSSKFSGKIRGFLGDYYKVYDNDQYILYKGEESNKLADSLDYIELYDKYYAAVKNHKLMLYYYNGNQVIDKEIALDSSTYYGKGSNAFMVASSGEKVVISVYKNGKYESNEKEMLPEIGFVEDEEEEIEE